MFNTYPASEINAKPKPPVKWAGGKGQLIPEFEPLFPKEGYDLYLEPFLGGGAVFFHLLPPRAILLDSNFELVNFYLVVRDNIEELLKNLGKHQNTPEYYYRIRALDPDLLTPVKGASRFLYLNKTAYNGLWRVNSQGKHNVPFGQYKNPKIADVSNLRLVSKVLKRAEIFCDDFRRVLDYALPGSFVYLDPPYHPLSETANFTSYTSDAFSSKDQVRLAGIFRELDKKHCFVMLSNSDTPFIRELYFGYDIRIVHARRAINRRADRRGPITELVIRNYV